MGRKRILHKNFQSQDKGKETAEQIKHKNKTKLKRKTERTEKTEEHLNENNERRGLTK